MGFSDLNTPDGTANPAKKAGLRLGDRVVRMDDTLTETNDAVHDALETAAARRCRWSISAMVSNSRPRLTPVWDRHRRAVARRDVGAGFFRRVGTMTFVDNAAGVFAGLGHPISDSDTGESVALRSGEIVPCQIVGCTSGTVGSPGELKGRFLSTMRLAASASTARPGSMAEHGLHFPARSWRWLLRRRWCRAMPRSGRLWTARCPRHTASALKR